MKMTKKHSRETNLLNSLIQRNRSQLKKLATSNMYQAKELLMVTASVLKKWMDQMKINQRRVRR